MPAGNQTGPMGMGPRTGRGFGYCSGNNAPGYANGGFGHRGGGFARGKRFWGAGYPGAYQAPVMTPEQERESLKAQAHNLEESLKAIQERLDKLDTGKGE